jgi:Cys-tRNA(Pro)/Cys-tRNA(Cys) deacylase
VDIRLHEFEHAGDQRYGLEAVAALGIPAERTFKTLVVTIDGGLAVALVPVDRSCDLKATAAALGAKRAAMADPRDAERATGYVVGGISPLGQKRRLPTVVDASATGFDTVFVSAGRRGLELEISSADLTRLTGAAVAPISV